jgi:predicted HAD superfamily Cof-like phosphohydrolase
MIKLDPTVEKVLEFHRVFKCHIEETPTIPTLTGAGNIALIEASRLLKKARSILREQGKTDVRCSRVALIAEETGELADAFVENDIKAVLDAFEDIGYVNAGGVVNCGLQYVYSEGMNRVHISNMSKTDENGEPIFDEAGKVVKGPFYQKVVLDDLVDGTWLTANPPKQKTRFEKLVEEAGELNISVLASSKYPDELAPENFLLQSSSNQDELLELLEAPKYNSISEDVLTEIKSGDPFTNK